MRLRILLFSMAILVCLNTHAKEDTGKFKNVFDTEVAKERLGTPYSDDTRGKAFQGREFREAFRLSKPKLNSLRPEMLTLVSKQKSAGQGELTANLESLLSGDMDDVSIEAMKYFLLRRSSDYVGMELTAYMSLKNDVLEYLITKYPEDDQIGDIMLYIVRNKSYSTLWREYVLQYYFIYYSLRWSSTGIDLEKASSNKQRKEFQRTIAQCLKDTDAGISGTALIVLSELSDDYPEFDKTIIHREAKRIAKKNSSSRADRIAAVQCLSEQPTEGDEELLLELVDSHDSCVYLKSAAIGALSRCARVNPEAKAALLEIVVRNPENMLLADCLVKAKEQLQNFENARERRKESRGLDEK